MRSAVAIPNAIIAEVPRSGISTHCVLAGARQGAPRRAYWPRGSSSADAGSSVPSATAAPALEM